MILTLKELADHLRVNDRTILRMLKSGQIQGTKIGGQWRFNGSQIDRLFFPEDAPVHDEVPLTALTRSHLSVPISRALDTEQMLMDLQATTMPGVIEELISPATLKNLVLDVGDLRERILARERLLSTGVGSGIAIPHPRDPVPTLRAPVILIYGCSRKGVDCQAMDNKPVRLFFVLCCQSIELHIHLMGRLAQLLRSEGFPAKCAECEEPEDVLRLVLEHERRQFLGSS